MINFYSYTIGNVCYNLLDAGIANFLGLETLNHGTNAFNYLGIRILGGSPSQGGKSTGSTKGWNQDYTQNYFYLFKDSEFNPPSNCGIPIFFKIPFIGKRILPRMHCFLSGYNFTARVIPEKNFIIFRYTKIFLGVIGGVGSLLLAPTLHFRFNHIKKDRLENDPMYDNIAYRTSYKVESWRIGLMGSLLTGLNLEWFSRIKAHPLKVMTGVVQIVSAVALTVLAASSPFTITPLIAGVILA